MLSLFDIASIPAYLFTYLSACTGKAGLSARTDLNKSTKKKSN